MEALQNKAFGNIPSKSKDALKPYNGPGLRQRCRTSKPRKVLREVRAEVDCLERCSGECSGRCLGGFSGKCSSSSFLVGQKDKRFPEHPPKHFKEHLPEHPHTSLALPQVTHIKPPNLKWNRKSSCQSVLRELLGWFKGISGSSWNILRELKRI